MAGMALGQIAVGPISDDKGRRLPLMVGMAIFTLSTVGCIWSPSIQIFLIFRLIQGCAGGAGIVLSRAIARDICKGSALTRLFAMLMLVNGIAPILAPVIGGQILRFAPWEGVFLFIAIVGLLLTVSAGLMRETLPQRRRVSGGMAASLNGFTALFRQPYFMGHCIMQCFAFAAFFAYISGSSFVFQNVYSVSAQAFSLIFGINGVGLMINGAVTGRLTGRIADWKLLRFSLFLAAVGSVALLAAFSTGMPLAGHHGPPVPDRIDAVHDEHQQFFHGYAGPGTQCRQCIGSHRILFHDQRRRHGPCRRHRWRPYGHSHGHRHGHRRNRCPPDLLCLDLSET